MTFLFLIFATMKVDEIYAIENTNDGCIHLVRDRLFWQAWEKSAFYFVKMFRPYKVHSRFVQKIGCQMVWLGFPKGILADFESEAKENGLQWNIVDENHIVVSGCAKQDKFDSWKQGVISNVPKTPLTGQMNLFDSVPTKVSACVDKDELLRLYRIAYDLCLYVLRNTAKVAKEFKFGLADKIRDEALLMVESLHLNVNGLECLDSKEIGLSLNRLRIKFRLLCDLRQISVKQWMFFNKQLEDLMKYSCQSLSIQGLGERANLVQ